MPTQLWRALKVNHDSLAQFIRSQAAFKVDEELFKSLDLSVVSAVIDMLLDISWKQRQNIMLLQEPLPICCQSFFSLLAVSKCCREPS